MSPFISEEATLPIRTHEHERLIADAKRFVERVEHLHDPKSLADAQAHLERKIDDLIRAVDQLALRVDRMPEQLKSALSAHLTTPAA